MFAFLFFYDIIILGGFMKSEEQNEIVRFLIVLAIVVVAVIGVYFFTSKFVTKESSNDTESESTAGVVNYNIAIVGNMLNKPEDEYYVFVYDYESENTDMYVAMNAISNYLSSGEDNLLKVYNVELDNYLNKSYKVQEGEKSNPKAKKIADFKFGDFTLIKVEKGKVEKYIENAEKIEKELTIDEKN